MADNTAIEWAEASLNPVRARDPVTGKTGWHCEHKTPGCEFCYAEAINHRLGTGHPFVPQARDRVELFLDDKTLFQPLRWQRGRVIFWHSMTDAFADFMRDEWLDSVLAVCALTPRHRHIFLTKRPDRMAEYFATWPLDGKPDRITEIARAIGYANRGYRGSAGLVARPLPNVLLGASVEDQRRADERRAPMRSLAAAGWKTLVSYEPALGAVNWQRWEFIAGLISGGESGPNARGVPRPAYRMARDFCQAHGIAFFHKQNGTWVDADEHAAGGKAIRPAAWDRFPERELNYTEAADLAAANAAAFEHHSDGSTLLKVGKKAAGRLLDGREHSELPA